MPTGAGCGGGHCISEGSIQDFVALLLAEVLQFLAEGVVLEGQDGDGVEGSVLRSVDGHRSDGDAGGHLDDGQEGVESVQGLGLHRDADDRQGGQGRDDARKVGGSSGAGDDDVEPVVPGGTYVVGQRPGVAMGAEDTFFIRDTELFEGGAGRGHDVPVTGAAHDDGYLAHSVKRFSTNEQQS